MDGPATDPRISRRPNALSLILGIVIQWRRRSKEILDQSRSQFSSYTREGQGRAVRLLFETGAGWSTAVIILSLGLAVLPNLVLISMGVVIGHLPAAAKSGFASSAGHDVIAALVATGIFLIGSLLLGPYQNLLGTIVSLHLSDRLQGRLIEAVSGPVGIAHLEDPQVLDQLANAQGQLLYVNPSEAPVVMAQLVGDRLSGVIACGVVGWFEWWMGLGLLVMWLYVRRPIHRNQQLQVHEHQRGNSLLRRSFYFLQSSIRPEAAKEIRVFGLQDWIVDQYRTHWHDAMGPSHAHRRLYSQAAIPLSVLIFVVYLPAGGYVAWAGVHHSIGLGEVSVVLVMLLSTSSAGGVTLANFILAQMLPALPDLDSLEDNLEDRSVSLTGIALATELPKDRVRFEGVVFSYPRSSVDVIKDLDLEIPAGESTAIVGLNGAGKTTLIKLLTRLHDPTSGTILIDGRPLSEFDPASWRRQVSVVYQEFNRYPISVAENIGFGAHEHLDDFEGIVSAARRTGSVGTIENLPEGWDTILSRQYTGGTDFSGGQWQRIALARALFAVQHGARILVLDEPTAWLDVRGEAEFFDRFLEITSGVTSIIISHRFSTVRRADRICVLSEGRISEQGSHAELVGSDGRYAHMFKLQAARFSSTEIERDPTNSRVA
jgi:ATP-binding cassette, subfamily B, bacterial